jgi:hypothetical protein
MDASGDDALHLSEPMLPNERLQFLESIFASDEHNLINTVCGIEGADRMRDYWPIVEQRECLIEAHPPAAAARDDDRRQHAAVG